jgi:hypothetical protein
MKKLLTAIVVMAAAIILLLLMVLAYRTARFTPPEDTVAPAPEVAMSPGAAERLAAALRIPPISHGESPTPGETHDHPSPPAGVL